VPALLALILLAPESGVAAAETEALKALAAGDVAGALNHFEAAIRAADDTPTKARLRDLYRKAGWAEPRPTNHAEQLKLAGHVQAEKIRVFAAEAGRLEREGRIHAAILVRRSIIEMLGGLDAQGAKPHANRVKRMIRKLTEGPSDEEKELVAKLLRAKKLGTSLLRAGRKLLERRQFKVVVRLCQEMMFGDFDQEIQNEALALRKEAERTAANDVPEADKEAALAVLGDERFDRLDVALSRHFMFLGPRKFVQALTTEERTMLDLAYIFQSDLSGQNLTFNGVRICVYYQETFDFGGGLAGGKLIRIGRRAIRRPIAGMLHYHELGHCIFGRGWLHHGFTEGLADFAAGFTLDLLGQTRAAQRFIVNARDQFVRYYLGRAVRYFHVQPYRPSAGFLFSFLPPGEAPFDWAPYRRVFHRMRAAQFGAWPEREHQLMRYFGYLLSTEYGARTLDTLREWGWPVRRADRSRVPRESAGLLASARRGEFLLSKGAAKDAEGLFREVRDAAPDGPLAPRARYGLLRIALSRGDEEAARRLRRRLGIVDAFRVLGPYHARRQTAYVVFPPETRIDLSKPLRFGYETARWEEAKVRADGFVDLRDQGYGYPEHACAFALCYVRTDQPRAARIWLGSNDGHTLYVNNELAEKRDTHRGFRFDDDFADVELKSGWNRILLKVHNGSGAWGFLMRVVGRDGEPLPVRFSIDDLEARVRRFEPPKTDHERIVADEFRGLRSSRWMTMVGRFDTQNGRLRPRETARLGLWQRFVVDPDKPPTGPANLMWLKSPDLARADSFELELVVAGGKDGELPAKFGFTIDGENQNDGQSGHTFVFDANEKKLRCHWYRYDRLLFLQPGVEVEAGASFRFRLVRHGRKWWLTVDDVPLFNGVDAPRLPALGFGIMTWGRAPEFESVSLVRLEPR